MVAQSGTFGLQYNRGGEASGGLLPQKISFLSSQKLLQPHKSILYNFSSEEALSLDPGNTACQIKIRSLGQDRYSAFSTTTVQIRHYCLLCGQC